jgi:hypothetical protein
VGESTLCLDDATRARIQPRQLRHAATFYESKALEVVPELPVHGRLATKTDAAPRAVPARPSHLLRHDRPRSQKQPYQCDEPERTHDHAAPPGSFLWLAPE